MTETRVHMRRIVAGDGFSAFKLASGGPYWRDEDDTKSDKLREQRAIADLSRKELGFRLARDVEG